MADKSDEKPAPKPAPDAPPKRTASVRKGAPQLSPAPFDYSWALVALVVASLLLHVPTYLMGPGASLGMPAALRTLGVPLPVPAAAGAAKKPQAAGAAKKYGDPEDNLDGPGFDSVDDYVCETGFKGVRILNRDPLMVVIDGFMRKGEPEYIMEMARPLLSRSTVLENNEEATTVRNVSDVRTSSTAFLPRRADPILRCVEDRASVFSGIPIQNHEGLQVTYYNKGQFYQPHFDYFAREIPSMAEELKRGGQRITTLFAYLNAVALPPNANTANAAPYVAPGTARPASSLVGAGSTQFPTVGLEVFPIKGSAAFWWDVDLDGQDDPRTLHAGTAPLFGEKWGLNVWTREGPFA